MQKLSRIFERSPAARAQGYDPRHAGFPIQQFARSRAHTFQLAFAREAAARLGDCGSQLLCEHSFGGLRILGRSEIALAEPARTLENWYGADVELTPPEVRYQFGDVVQEPVMSLVVRVPWRFAPAVRNDLYRRDGRIHHYESRHRMVCTAEAQATQAELLGYPAWLEALTAGAGNVEMWLSHYQPIDREPGPAAA